MMAALTFLILAASILGLTVLGGGIFPITVAIVAALLAGAVAIQALATRRPTRTAVPWVELGAALILLFVLATAIPIPPPLDALAGGLRHQQNQTVVTSLRDATQMGMPPSGTAPWFSLSRNRAGTLRFFLLLAAAFSAGLIAASLPAKWKLGHLHFLALLGTAVGVAGYLGQWKIPQGDTIWWLIPIPHSVTSPVGCFLNRNHFGGFVAMLCPVALALADHHFRHRRWIAALFHLALTGAMMTVVMLSLSRGAMLALAVGLAVATLVIAFRHRAIWGFLLLVLMLAGGGLILVKHPVVRQRVAEADNPAEIASVQSRWSEWRESLRVWPHYPVLGAGMNALRMVYPQHRQTSVGGRLLFAENEYIQLLTEGGLIGVALAGTLILAMRHRVRGAPLTPTGTVILAVTGAATVSGVHCLFDFPAHLPLYALVLGSIIGLILPSPQETISTRRWLALLPTGIVLAATFVLSLGRIEDLRNLDDPDYLYTATYRDLHRALVWAPTSSAWLYLGRNLIRDGSATSNPALCVTGESFVTRMAQLDPQNYRLWYELGQIRLGMKDYDRAVEAFQHAQQLRSWLSPPPIPGRK